MIIEMSKAQNSETFRGDVCVIGTGPAGAEAISFLRRHGLRVVVAEGGRRDFDKAAQELTRSENIGLRVREPNPNSSKTPYLDPKYRGEGRLRQFGGNSNIWTGKWREFEPLDFDVRPHIPLSGWPISYDEMVSLWRAIERDYGFGDFEAAPDATGHGPFLERMRDTTICTTFHYWEGDPLRVPARFEAAFSNDPEIEIVLGAHAVELIQNSQNDEVARLRCRSMAGEEVFFEARHFVLAMGGIETPRLLLASDGKYASGVGNSTGLVGRHFADHPKIKSGVFWPGAAFDLLPDGAADFPRPRFKASFSLSRKILDEHELLNHTVQFSPLPGGLRGRLRKLASQGSYGAAIGQFAQAWRSGTQHQPLRCTISFEQEPNPESTVTLSDTRDAVGMRMTRLNWQFTELDRRNFGKTIDLLSQHFPDVGLGRFDFGNLKLGPEDMYDSRHHMGTTRMARSPEEGVVDADCRVFGSKNVFVASGAVFPTGHSFGPTLTILAMARRACHAILSDHGIDANTLA